MKRLFLVLLCFLVFGGNRIVAFRLLVVEMALADRDRISLVFLDRSSNLPRLESDDSGLLITHAVSADPELAVVVESSVNLRDWTQMESGTNYIIDSESVNLDGTRDLSLRIMDADEKPRGYFRASVERMDK